MADMAQTAQHTPGEWEASPYFRNGHKDPPSGWHVGPKTKRAISKTLNAVCDVFADDEGEANARLIAAAPDMLAELRRIAGKIDQSSGSPKFSADEHDGLVALIARAEGR